MDDKLSKAVAPLDLRRLVTIFSQFLQVTGYISQLVGARSRGETEKLLGR